jgi:PilZ domain-containing protein
LDALHQVVTLPPHGLTLPIFIVLPQAESRIGALASELAGVSEVAARASARGAELYYSTSKGAALVALFFDPSLLTEDTLATLIAAAARGGAAVVDAARLPDRARRRFHDEYLPLYDVRRSGLVGFDDALQALAAHLGTPTATAQRIEVRFRRGDNWRLGRVRSMTREGMSIATCTPPRRGDVVDLDVTAGNLTLLTRSTVVGVATGDTSAALGATGFGARFLLADDEERRRLESILALAGGDRLRALEPPPRRRAARYPVCWPVHLRSSKGRLLRSALDVSRHGMFVGCDADTYPTEGSVHLTIPIDDRGTPVLATARVARAIGDPVARKRGLACGIGIEITAISQRDEQRFSAFVGRVARRAEREVLIGAAPGRVAELTGALLAAGYCATGVTDAASLVARASTSPRVPDLAVIDSTLVRANPRAVQVARRALAVRLIPLLSLDGDAASVAREAVDEALLA